MNSLILYFASFLTTIAGELFGKHFSVAASRKICTEKFWY